MSYRKKYERVTNRKLPGGYDIHHIDGNRKNNDIYNLLALPAGIHRKYHKIKNDSRRGYSEMVDDLYYSEAIIHCFEDWIVSYIEIQREVMLYLQYRDYLLGDIPLWATKINKEIY